MTAIAQPPITNSGGSLPSNEEHDFLSNLGRSGELDISSDVVVVGVGNVLLKDEGVGVHVAHALQEMASKSEASFDVIDGGTSPDVFLLVSGVRKLVIADAASGGGEPGSIYRFRPDDIVPTGGYAVSAHQIDLMGSLRMMELSGSKPDEIVIIGVEPRDIGWGMELSPELGDKLPKIIKVVMDEAKSK